MQTFAHSRPQNQNRVPLARSRIIKPGLDLRQHPTLPLQAFIGNQEVSRTLQSQAEGSNAQPTAEDSPRFGHDFSRIPIHPTAARVIQTKLAVNQPGDKYEQEADSVTKQVMRMPEPQLQRKCACGGNAGAGAECPECRKKRLQRKDTVPQSVTQSGAIAPPVVHEVLRSPGQPLDAATRAFMEQRFGQDFGSVRVHTDAKAGESARAVNALAYTVGRDIAFAYQRYQPTESSGRQLLAHELTHVVQQDDPANSRSTDSLIVDSGNSSLEKEARIAGAAVMGGGVKAAQRPWSVAGRTGSQQVLSRADPDAVGYTMRMGRTLRTGLQFVPTNVTDTRVGPVTAQGGLLGGGANQLNVIIGENLTLRRLARQLLPLWTTATPFTPSGAAAPLPLDIITEAQLAQGLLVYNQTYLPVPAMTNWRSGLRFPLPVEIDDATGMATLHPLQIRALAGAFNPAWLPQLDLPAQGVAAVPAATLQGDVAAFLARATSALDRGIHLGAQALTNAAAELPFIQETFRQLGPASFDVALAFTDNLINQGISVLAAQRDGATIIAEIRRALATAPAALTATQQASLDRANLMLGLVAGVAAQAPPGSARTRAEKTITVDTVKLDGSSLNPSTEVAVANSIFSQCNVRVNHGVNATATHAQTIGWLGGNTDLRPSGICGAVSAEETSLFRGAAATFGLGARFRAFFPATLSGISASGYSYPPFCATGPASSFLNTIVAVNSGDDATLAHELAHILRNSGTHPAGTVAGGRPAPPAMRSPQLTDPQCTTIYNHV